MSILGNIHFFITYSFFLTSPKDMLIDFLERWEGRGEGEKPLVRALTGD